MNLSHLSLIKIYHQRKLKDADSISMMSDDPVDPGD